MISGLIPHPSRHMRIGRYDDRSCGDAGSARMSSYHVDSNGRAIGPISSEPAHCMDEGLSRCSMPRNVYVALIYRCSMLFPHRPPRLIAVPCWACTAL